MTRPYDFSKLRKTLTKSIDGLSVGFNDPKTWISTGNYALNYLISGDFNKGVPLGKVTMFAGESGCLPEFATVEIKDSDDTVRTVSVRELKELFESSPDSFLINTPDGFQKITKWFDKGSMYLVKVTTKSGLVSVCAEQHLLQRDDNSWVSAACVQDHEGIITVNSDSDEVISVVPAGNAPCYDFTVDHPNHRYWGDGFSSHNSGKSYICSGNLARNAQEQGVYVVLVDTENALDEAWLHALGVDTSPDKLLKLNMAMIDDVAKTISEFMKEYRAMSDEDRPKVLFIIDSLGMLLTPTDTDQFNRGELKGDMGRKPKALNALVRNCVNMFGEFDVGLVCTNHTYASQDPYSPDPNVSGGCLTAGHKIWMADGSAKNIEDVAVGDVVVTLQGDHEVNELFHYTDKEVFELVLEDGEVIQATGEHMFLTKSEDNEMFWKTVDELSEGDEIIKVV